MLAKVSVPITCLTAFSLVSGAESYEYLLLPAGTIVHLDNGGPVA